MGKGVCSACGVVVYVAIARLGCSLAASQPYQIFEPTMTCQEARQISAQVVERLGYRVIAPLFTRTHESVVKGTRRGLTGQETIRVKIICSEAGVQVDVLSEFPPCEQANRILSRTIERLGYRVTAFTPASYEREGMIKGERADTRERKTVTATIVCDEDVVVVETPSDSPLLGSPDFSLPISDVRRGFFSLFKATADLQALKAKPSSREQVYIVVQPLIGRLARAELGTEVSDVLPVRIEVMNLTQHTYLLDANKIVLLATLGQRVQPLSPSDNTLPIRALTNQRLVPGTKIKGYLFYPAGFYTGARGFLLEKKSQKREEFNIQF